MSTSYYPLKAPFTDLQLRSRTAKGKTRHGLIFSVNNEVAGTITLTERVQPTEVTYLFADTGTSYQITKVGAKGGKTKILFPAFFDPKAVLISEYGDLTTLNKLLAESDK